MTATPAPNAKAVARAAAPIRALIQSLHFDPSIAALLRELGRVFEYHDGVIRFDPKAWQATLDSLQSRFPNVGENTFKQPLVDLLRAYLDEFVAPAELPWDTAFTLAQHGLDQAPDEWLLAWTETLLTALAGTIRPHTVYVPIYGVELDQPQFAFGPVQILRPRLEFPGREAHPEFREVQSIDRIIDHLQQAPAVVLVDVDGDTAFAREHALHVADKIVAILNLHEGVWSITDRYQQKIVREDSSPAYSTRLLARCEYPDDQGNRVPVYLPAVETRGIVPHTVSQTKVNGITHEWGTGVIGAFEVIWNALDQPSAKSDSISGRIANAVRWYNKAVNFDEPDAQFVGLATALEILLVRTGDISNPFSSWAGITQQLADRCAFLLASALDDTMQLASQVKQLYGVRSKIVHSGGHPTETDLRELADLVSRAILDLAQKNFSSFQEFENWIKLQHYSVNLNEIDRYRGRN